MSNSVTECILSFGNQVKIVHQSIRENKLFFVLDVHSSHATCPACQTCTHRKHSTYIRKVDDLPLAGHQVHLDVHLHKWFCENQRCLTKVFTERLDWLRPYGRKTERLESIIRSIGFATNCIIAEKVCRSMNISISHDTILRRIKRERFNVFGTYPFRRYR
ncbi:transposase family protein [Bacillus sp. Hm123]|uniref:transposase family protein n=1 Tax=Bacillus sp. Hm123 TaxID=3450745 RepID=UPI003F430EDA